jgi:uncharacterized protein (UPF0332 family)
MTPEQQALLQKAYRSLEAARKLDQDGFHDFSISRAYYAMFYVAEAFLDSIGMTFSSHAAVISAFGQHLARPGIVPVEFHRYLIDAQDLRTQADYDASVELTAADALKQLDHAEQFLNLANEQLG